MCIFNHSNFFLLPKSEIEDSEPPRLGFEVTKRLNFTISIYWQGGTIPKHLDWHRKEEKEHLKGKQNIYFYLLWIFKLFLSYTLMSFHILKADIMNHMRDENLLGGIIVLSDSSAWTSVDSNAFLSPCECFLSLCF